MSYLTTLLTVVVVVAMAAIRVASAQPSCASNLVHCVGYMNATTRPPASCCDPIRNDLTCLCNLYKNPSSFRGLGVNVTQALNLPALCGIPGDVSACSTESGLLTWNEESISLQASQRRLLWDLPMMTGTQGMYSKNDGTKVASAGIFSFLLIAASMVLY